MMKHQLIAPMAALAVAGAFVQVRPAHAGPFSLSEQDEIRAGQQVAAQAQREYGRALPADDPRSIRVRRIGQAFARLSNRRNIPYSYTVLQNNKVLNAFAAPGGPIFVTTKLLETASNDAELAYVIGHETGHIDRKHIVRSVEKQQQRALGIGILGAILGGGRGVGTIGAVVNAAVTQKYSRNDERDSDDWGIRRMAQLGYDPRAAITMLGKLGGRERGGLEKYLASHPSPSSRQDRARDLIQKENLVAIAQRNGARLNDNNSTLDEDDEPTIDDTPTRDLGAPLRFVDKNGSRVILAPVAGFARWAGAEVEADDRTVTLSRGNSTITLREGSPFADVNGRSQVMSVSARVFDGRLYAPVGIVADALNVRTGIDNERGTLTLTRSGGASLSVQLP